MEALKNRGVHLYQASGTDLGGVKHEAEILGSSELFGDRIFGSVGDITKYFKRMVINSIITKNKLSGDQLLVVWDRPVEISECNHSGGISVGVASDESKTFGFNMQKQKRLTNSNAEVIIPIFYGSSNCVVFYLVKI